MEIAERTHLIDVQYLGRPGSIAACLIETREGPGIVDPGPSNCVPALARELEAHGIGLDDLRFILLTHIHLDHAGATGTLARDNPRLRVHVHEAGAAHLADPTRLLASALRIYGDQLGPLFGEFLAVPAAQIHALAGGESLNLGDRTVRIAHAPGHAKHHIACLDEESGTLFMGDTAGERFAPSSYVLPVTPPPDIDIERWKETLATVRVWNAETLFITHFGAFRDVAPHLDAIESSLEDWADRVRLSLEEPGDDEEKASRFESAIHAQLRSMVEPPAVDDYTSGGGIRDSWFGLARYWRQRRP
jgi:glyoxylase-like metal-dependent hydrolase (beta-lactamase superfamily II)